MKLLRFFFCLLLVTPAFAIDWGNITDQQAGKGAKEALVQGADAAIAALAKENGYMGNPNVKIPLPPTLAKTEKLLRKIGLKKQMDELSLRMNRAAESAVIEAKPILLDSIRKMTLKDVKDILTGPDDSVTQYFRKTCSPEIGKRFLPKVQTATEKVKVAETYNHVAGQAANLGLMNKEEANLDQFITGKAVDGLFFMIAEKEKAIRADPVKQTSQILRTVFGALRQ